MEFSVHSCFPGPGRGAGKKSMKSKKRKVTKPVPGSGGSSLRNTEGLSESPFSCLVPGYQQFLTHVQLQTELH